MSKQKETNNYGIGFVGLLQIAFVVLKLCEVIKWSWLWVLSPFWIYAILLVLIVLIAFIYVKINTKKQAKYWVEKIKEVENKNKKGVE